MVSHTFTANMTGHWETTGKKADGCKAKPTHDEEVDQARMQVYVCSSDCLFIIVIYFHIKSDATLHWFTCRRALPALYFSYKEWCWIRCPGRCRCYSLHLGKGLGWDRAFGSLKCWTDTLFSLWPGKNNRNDANAKKVPHLRVSFLLSAYSSQISALMTLLHPIPRDWWGWLPIPYGGLFQYTKLHWLLVCAKKHDYRVDQCLMLLAFEMQISLATACPLV